MLAQGCAMVSEGGKNTQKITSYRTLEYDKVKLMCYALNKWYKRICPIPSIAVATTQDC